MANTLREMGHGVALQVTVEARSAGLVEEDPEGEATYRADVWAYSVDGALLVVDADRVGREDRAGLVASAARDTGSIYAGATASIQHSGNGYRVQLPSADRAGLEAGDTPSVRHAPGLLVIYAEESGLGGERLAADLCELRRAQVER